MSGMLRTFRFARTRRLNVGEVRRARLGAIGVVSFNDGNVGIGVCSRDNMVWLLCFIVSDRNAIELDLKIMRRKKCVVADARTER